MAAAEPTTAPAAPDAAAPPARRRPSAFAVALGLILLLALALRVWGLRTGLPFVYNVDEGAHFVPRAIGFFDHTYDPGYFINPPSFTYLLHFAFWVRWGGDGVREQFAADPTPVFALARAFSAVLGTAAVGLLAWLGVRLFDRRVALVAAFLLAVAFLPVHYGHFALNDSPTLAPLVLSLVGAAGIYQRGHTGDYVLAGVGLGLATATKYTAAIGVLPIVAAAALGPGDLKRRLRDLVLAGAVSLAAFFVANPHALLSFHQFRTGLREQSEASSDGGGKLGLANQHGLTYYAGTLAWGLGIVPALAALGGAVALLVRDRRLAAVLLPLPVVYLLFMGTQDRFFARWLLPVYPVLALLAAYAAVLALDALRGRIGALRRPALAVGVAGLVLGIQGVVYAVHNDVVLSREDTRAIARAWMVRHIPEGSKIVVEPIAPDPWVTDPGSPSQVTSTGARWLKRPGSHFRILPDGRKALLRKVKLEDYERTLRPDLLSSYARGGYCWVVTGSTQYGRAAVEPEEAPWAIRYYRELRRVGRVVYTTSPLSRSTDEPAFSFDDSFNYRPLGYHRPGPRIVIYRLDSGDCRVS
jgi:hypothetical protein